MGIFYPYIPFENTRLVGVEAAGEGLDSGKHAASLQRGSPGVLHGNRTYILQDANGQITETHSISAGLDYPGVGPEHAWLRTAAGRGTWALPMPRHWLHFTTCAAQGHHPSAGVSHAWLCPYNWHPRCAQTSPSWSTSRVAVTKTSAPWLTCQAQIFIVAQLPRPNR